jgi:hypothetical protein
MIIIGSDTPELQFPTVLTHEEWSRIAQATNLPDEARTEEVRANINDFIGLYRQSQSHAKSQKTVCKKLQHTKDMLERCCESLGDLLSDPQVFVAIAAGFDGQMKIPPKVLARARSLLQKLYQQLNKYKKPASHFFDKALERVHRTKHGRRTGRDSLDMLVRLLNSLFKQYIGKRIVRSENRVKKGCFHSTKFVLEVCRIANDKIPETTVMNAIKRVVTEDRDEQECVIDDSDQLLPLTKKSGKVPFKGKSRTLMFLPVPGGGEWVATKDYVSWRVMSSE